MSIPDRAISKSKFSQYLRSQCDKALYLSLFSNNPESLRKANIPIPLKSRPGVQMITQSGREFEADQYNELIRAIPEHVIHNSNGLSEINLLEALTNINVPSFILQPAFEPQNFREHIFDSFRLSSMQKSLIPRLSGLRPDVLYIRPAEIGEYEVLPDGSRRRIENGEARFAISVIDLKNIKEANASYSAEVCLYAIFLANWLETEGAQFQNSYFVSHNVYLWKHIQMPSFHKACTTSSGNTPLKRVNALVQDLEDGLVSFLIFMPSVRKFFKEDIPRVVKKGDEEGWETLTYHVNSKCSSCDFLGNEEWLIGDDRQKYNNNPLHYCVANAESNDHLSKLASLSKGASKILADDGLKKVEQLVDVPANSQTLKKHAILKRERSQLSEKARALCENSTSIDETINISGLARYAEVNIDIVVNFDSGSGLLTGIAIRGILFSPFNKSFQNEDGTQSNFIFLGDRAFVVPSDNNTAEWTAVQSFINTLASWLSRANQAYQDHSWTSPPKTQICFWEPRQYKELCNSFGRHLLSILTLNERSQRALAWIFPADELLEKQEQVIPGIVFIKDIVNHVLRTPVRFTNTLLGVVQHYHSPQLSPKKVDNYYVEPLGNAIPRERIFEIWKSTTGTVRYYGRDISISEAITNYENALKAQTWALSSIAAKLKDDLGSRLKGSAPRTELSTPSGMRGVAIDSKLWNQWDKVSAATGKTEGKIDLLSSPEKLESSFKAIILTSLVTDLGSNQFEYEVGEESTESKLEEGDSYCVLGIVGQPGFPLLKGSSLPLNIIVNPNPGNLFIPIHNVISVTIDSFDRINQKIVISLKPRSEFVRPVFQAIINANIIPFREAPIYLMKGLPYDDAKTTKKILGIIGNPSISFPSQEALVAMGKSRAPQAAQRSAITPIAQVLWQGNVLANTTILDEAIVNRITEFAKTANDHELNDSQVNAVRSCIQSQLSIIWGPPGTGKTDTLVAMLHALVNESNHQNGMVRNVLVTGPNYRAVEELSERLLENLNADTNSVADIFWVYSKSRDPKNLPDIAGHFSAYSLKLTPDTQNDQLIRDSIGSNRVTIISTTAHAIPSLTKYLYGDDTPLVKEIFDLVIIDESSQVEVTKSFRPLSVLKNSGQLIIAGDHLQMPPIFNLDPPLGAEYLVGSIQTYLLQRFSIQTQNLLVNYRSNLDLVNYAKTLGYPVELEPYNSVKDLYQVNDIDEVVSNLPDTLPQTIAYKELLVPTRRVTAFIHEDDTSSQANHVEAKLVAGLIYCLRHSMANRINLEDGNNDFSSFTDREFFKNGVGVVTPHKAQKALVVNELRAMFPHVNTEEEDEDIIYDAVDTVERFQGGQRQTIIVSFGVGDIDIIEGEEAFLLQLERTNVAVSRAQAKCIVIMPKSLAYHLPSDKKSAETAFAIKSYVEEFCGHRIQSDITWNGEVRSGEVRWH